MKNVLAAVVLMSITASAVVAQPSSQPAKTEPPAKKAGLFGMLAKRSSAQETAKPEKVAAESADKPSLWSRFAKDKKDDAAAKPQPSAQAKPEPKRSLWSRLNNGDTTPAAAKPEPKSKPESTETKPSLWSRLNKKKPEPAVAAAPEKKPAAKPSAKPAGTPQKPARPGLWSRFTKTEPDATVAAAPTKKVEVPKTTPEAKPAKPSLWSRFKKSTPDSATVATVPAKKADVSKPAPEAKPSNPSLWSRFKKSTPDSAPVATAPAKKADVSKPAPEAKPSKPSLWSRLGKSKPAAEVASAKPPSERRRSGGGFFSFLKREDKAAIVASTKSVPIVGGSPTQPVSHVHTDHASNGSGNLWSNRSLRWRIASETVPAGLDRARLEAEIDRCFNYWEGSGIFRFEKTLPGEAADIIIAFGKPPEAKFDEDHARVAYGFYPWSSRPGSIFLDPQERWTTGSYGLTGESIDDWLPHEIGHVLGLRHSHGEGDVMHPVGPFKKPSQNDFANLREVYGLPGEGDAARR
jgi:hypothetical protein